MQIDGEADLSDVIELGHRPIMILGDGSNVLFARDYQGLIIHNSIQGISIIEQNDQFALVEVGGGVIWHELVLWALDHHLGGIENLSLIPGTVGAAPVQNIGAYGVEFDTVFHSLMAMDLETGQMKKFDKVDCGFSYRDSVFKSELRGKYCITRVCLQLDKKPHVLQLAYGGITSTLEGNNVVDPTIRDVSDAVISLRQSKLPDPNMLGNAGSFFKNPVIDYSQFEMLRNLYPDMPSYDVDIDRKKIPAAWLIEMAGWKGFRKGDAGIYEKHALVLVNHGEATGPEMFELAMAVQTSVEEIFGIKLEMEVNVI